MGPGGKWNGSKRVIGVCCPCAASLQPRRGACYLRGRRLDGPQKPIQPMVARLPDGLMQALQQFVSQSPWDPCRSGRIAERLSEVIASEAWVATMCRSQSTAPRRGRDGPPYCGAVGNGRTVSTSSR
jgi:hypothetical protein